MNFDIEFEEAIIAQALRDPEYLKKASRLCDSHHFGSPERAWVWEGVRETWLRYREVPTARLMLARSKHDFPDAEKREPYLKTVQKLFKLKPKAPGSALEELEKFVRFVNAQLALEKGAEALEKGRLDDAYTAMNTAVRTTIGTRKYTLINWSEEFEDRQARRKWERDHPDAVVSIPTGWPTIDKRLSGGSRPGELIGIMGTTGRGKSIALNNITMSAIRRGHEALYIGFEMPARQIAARQDSRWLQLEYNKLKEYDMTPSELRAIKNRYDKAAKHFASKLKIASFPVRSATIMDVYGLLDDIATEYVDEKGNPWRPKVILLDSADHLKAIDTVRESFRLQQSEVYWSSAALAEDSGCVVYTSVHAGKEWAAQIAQAEGASESYDKSRILDTLISINDPNYKQSRRKAKVETDDDDDDDDEQSFEVKEQTGERPVELHMAKSRDGESHFTVKAVADYRRMTIRELEHAVA